MADYIDREKLLELINEDCKYKNPTNGYTRGCNEVCDWAIKTIKNIPTADVVPKSEVEALELEIERLKRSMLPSYYSACTEEEAIKIGKEYGKQEVSREIFEEIAQISCKISESDGNGNIRILCYQLSSKKLAELKKKHTEV